MPEPASSPVPVLTYLLTDEAPRLSAAAWLPVLSRYLDAAGIGLRTRDISLSRRILAAFADILPAGRVAPGSPLDDAIEAVAQPGAVLIKPPSVSASVAQLKAAVAELQGQGYPLPDYPDQPAADDAARDIARRYAGVTGSTVNPRLRLGNSIRRLPAAVKQQARRHPHPVADWPNDSRAHVAHMSAGDFYGSERSVAIDAPTRLRVVHIGADGATTVLKDAVTARAHDIVDAAVLSRRALRRFLRDQVDDARRQGVLFSLHLKATLMKATDPVIFGDAVSVFFDGVLQPLGAALQQAGFRPEHGSGGLKAAVDALPAAQRDAARQALQAHYAAGPALVMADAGQGHDGLHAPGSLLIDAAMAALIRDGGRMIGPDGRSHDTKAVIPDRCYALMFKAVIEDCQAHGRFDPATMGSVPCIGLIAHAAQEQCSHDKTFLAPADGRIVVQAEDGRVLLEHAVEAGDLWRMCQTRADAIDNWAALAVDSARRDGVPAVFWLDPQRAHDRLLQARVDACLAQHDTQGLDLRFMAPADAARYTCARARAGQDTIAVTGNVLRDYLTDLFPILESGTSASSLSLLPLLAGGLLAETGAGGTAPRHYRQFLDEGFLRWNPLGEHLAITAALDHLALCHPERPAGVLARTLDQAADRVLADGRTPARTVGGLDTRGSHFYVGLYWAQALAEQRDDAELAARFAALAAQLSQDADLILAECQATQGRPMDLGGYFHPDDARVDAALFGSGRWAVLLAGF